MLSSETFVILLGTLLFFGFAAWMAFYTGGNETGGDDTVRDRSEDEATAPMSNGT